MPPEPRPNRNGAPDEGSTTEPNASPAAPASPADETVAFQRPIEKPSGSHLFPDGTLVLNRFNVVRFVGAGGMGEVYEAMDKEMGRVALKTVRRDISSQPQVISHLKQEVIIARQIASPYVCRLYEFFPIPGEKGQPDLACFTMEFLEGRTLLEWIRLHGRIRWPDAVRFAMQICDGLAAIHRAGVIHRDLKSGNIMLVERRGEVDAVVMDFGLARRSAAEASSAKPAGSAGRPAAGTPAYMAPEQFRGEEVTPATDIYSLGVVLYEMIAGQHPFGKGGRYGTPGEREQQVKPLSSVVPDAPPELDRVIRHCIQADPIRRFQSTAELTAALSPQRIEWRRVLSQGAGLLNRHRIAGVLVVACLLAAVIISRPRIYKPPADAMSFYKEGVAALYEGAYVAATTSLQKAVDRDNSFVLAHARLAEAWTELDFTGKGEHEMLLASSIRPPGRLARLDAEYLDAVRLYIAEDFADAMQSYKRILRELPAAQKSAGYLDLARTEEKAGNFDGALKYYSQAAVASSGSPAPFLRRAVLEGRANQVSASERDFATAADLYRAANNREGLAEVDYQRGYAMSLHGQLAQAKELLEHSLDASREIGSPQLQIRTLTRLAMVSYGEGQDDQAIQLANQAIETARDSGLPYWAIDARIRMANAYQDRGDLEEAQAQLRQALTLAQEGKVPRLTALGNWSFAVLRDQQDDPDSTILYASKALTYYQREHFNNEALQCFHLINRAKLEKADFESAIAGGMQALELAHKTNNAVNLYPAEEFLGMAFLERENYPNALKHFEAALAASRKAGLQTEYQLLHCADALWRLGRYKEASQMMGAIPTDSLHQAELATQRFTVLAEMSISQGDFRSAISFAQSALAKAARLDPKSRLQAQIALIEAYSRSNSPREALSVYRAAQDNAAKLSNPLDKAQFSSAISGAFLAGGTVKDAEANALSALAFFSKSGEPESQVKTLWRLALISQRMGVAGDARAYATKALDLMAGLAHNWDSGIYDDYISRPDIKGEQRQLSALAER